MLLFWLPIEDASTLLEKQEEGRQESHSRIVGDIDNIKHNIDEVWQRVGEYTLDGGLN